MITLNKLVSDLHLIARGGQIADDDPIELEQIKDWVHDQRALWLRNELNKSRSIDDNIVQDLGCVEMERVDAAQCCGITSDCIVIRSKLDIPVGVELHQRSAITRVGPINKAERQLYSFLPFERAVWAGNGQFNKNNIFSFLLNNRMHLIGNPNNDVLKMIKYINIRGVFEDPTEAAKFSFCTGGSCYTDNDKYPINRWLLDYLKAEILKSKFALITGTNSDTKNDAENNQENTGKVQS